MKRITVRPAILLFLSANLNVLVTWVMVVAFRGQQQQMLDMGYSFWNDDYDWGVMYEQINSVTFRVHSDYVEAGTHGFGRFSSLVFPQPDELIPDWAPLEAWDGTLPYEQVYEASGWPMLSLVGGFAYTYEGDDPDPSMNPNANLTIESKYSLLLSTFLRQDQFIDPFDRVVLPLKPIWPGFAVNTAFYTAVLWMIFVMPFKVRRWRRIRKHRCPNCAYQLEGSIGAGCPECAGIAMRSRRHEADHCAACHPPAPRRDAQRTRRMGHCIRNGHAEGSSDVATMRNA